MAKVGIIGASGYVGGELLRWLVCHPGVELEFASSQTNAGKPISQVHQNLKKVLDMPFAGKPGTADLVFLALPHGESKKFVPSLLESGTRVIDMSQDYRLSEEAVYGVPELHAGAISKAKLVANPGCFAIATILGLHPLAKLKPVPVVVDGKTGSSGSGDTPTAMNHHPERANDVRAYELANHCHIPEMEKALGMKLAFTPHSVPVTRGILVTSHAFMGEEPDWSVYSTAYDAAPFIRLVEQARTASVLHSNFCDIQFAWDAKNSCAVIVAAIDNLVKGAAGNAVQNMNLMLGLNEATGLRVPGAHPS